MSSESEALTRQSYPELDDEALDHFRHLATHRDAGATIVLYPKDCATCARIAAWANALGADLDSRGASDG